MLKDSQRLQVRFFFILRLLWNLQFLSDQLNSIQSWHKYRCLSNGLCKHTKLDLILKKERSHASWLYGLAVSALLYLFLILNDTVN